MDTDKILKKYRRKNKDKLNSKVNGIITRLLVSVIVFFITIILCNYSNEINTFVKDKVLSDNINFSKITNIYNKYFGNIVPIKNIDEEAVFKENIEYISINNYKDGYKLKVKNNYLVPIIESGIVVYSGNKEEYGNTIIIEGNDEIEYWYGNVDNISVKLYDYVHEGELLGTSNKDTLYLVFIKDNKYLDYDEVIS